MSQLKQIQAQVFCVGLQQDRDTLNKLMAFSMDSSLGDFTYANRIFNHIHDPSLFIYNLMIKASVKRGSFRSAISLFHQLREHGVWPDNYTYPYVLKGIGCIGEVREGKKVHAFVVKTGLEFDPYVCNSLMDMYAELGIVEGFCQVFEEMPERDNVSWNLMISGYVRCRRFEEAVDVYRRMRMESKEKPNEATVVSTLSACSVLRNLELGKEIHSYIANELAFTTIMGNALLDMYCKCGHVNVAREIFNAMTVKNVNCWTSMVTGYVACGQLDQALELFERSPSRDIVLWTAMINGYVQFNRFEEAIALFGEMQMRGVKPDKFIVVTLLTGCAQSGALEQGKWIHSYIDKNRITVDTVVGTALIEMYAKCGCIEKSLEIFNGLKEKDTTSWTSIICGLAMNGRTREALELFEAMQTFQNDEVIVPLYGALLSACRIYGNIDMGERLATMLAKVKSSDSSLHTLLASIYASADRWEDVRKVRTNMKNLGIKKVPGYSAIE
ncbi:hypothetical protein Fmac_001816 [Flemingia macrophylla]|uniref:Pentatricopeptide repeat-containing protein n=1 Tax=Flemingia macrophylla TaxID=520843 RepID=A0ABD1NI64_9FABA